MRKNLLILVLVMVLAIFAAACGSGDAKQTSGGDNAAPVATEKHKWDFQSWTWSGLHPHHQYVLDFADRVYELSGGRLEIEVHPRDAVVPHWESTEVTGQGVLDMTMDWPGVWSGRDVGFNLFAPPPMSLTEGWQVTSWFYDYGVIDIMREAYGEYNLYIPGVTYWQQESLHSTKPIRNVSDFRGLSVRTPPGITADFFQAMGAAPVVLPPAEVYSALDRGVVDAGEWVTPAGNFSAGYHEVAKYLIWPSPHQNTATIYVAVNKDSWNALSDELKAIFEAALREFSWNHEYGALLEDYKAVKQYVAAGNEHIMWADEDLREAQLIAMDLWRSYANQSELAARLVKELEEYMRLIGTLPE
ncbi:TRAP transporter substrate-binding protein DctP [Desulfitibacter alkalitolerans]|uniref:TRAP transporter substrate-binding protein DctP n=1 Tax=Desulfitibacter alkalitolerans TaxID=264641 RepID=UPI000481984A|nr:TRAP transporter substrate-binding protein DctP [Desulfitibacter alkalitolerans]